MANVAVPLQSKEARPQSLTSSFRPPGGPTPTRGFFCPAEPRCAPCESLGRLTVMRVLAGDIGGTKTSVAIMEIGPRRLSVGRHARYPSSDYASIEHVLDAFLAGDARAA